MPRPKSKNPRIGRKGNAKAADSDNEEFPDERASGDESQEELEKDQEEDDLEKMVLGDAGGWKASMGMGMDLVESDEEVSGEDEEKGLEKGLEGLDDADVSQIFSFWRVPANSCRSSSFWTQGLQLLMRMR